MSATATPSSLASDGDVSVIIASLGLAPHPEGGFYARVFTSDLTSVAAQGLRPAITSIYYLCRAGEKSSLHELRSDELWFWHAGDALEVVELSNTTNGNDTNAAVATVTRTRIGPAIGSGLVAAPIRFSHGVRAGITFGAACVLGGTFGYTLVSCAVAPGFDFSDWKMEKAEILNARFRGLDAAAAIAQLASR